MASCELVAALALGFVESFVFLQQDGVRVRYVSDWGWLRDCILLVDGIGRCAIVISRGLLGGVFIGVPCNLQKFTINKIKTDKDSRAILTLKQQ